MKNLSKTMLAVLAVGLLSCGLFCQQAQAVPIAGKITFGGSVTLSRTVSIVSLVFDSVMITSTTGAYAPIPTTTAVDFFGPFKFDANTLEVIPQTFFQLWAITFGGNTYQFSMQPLDPNELISGNAIIGPPTWSFAVSGRSEASAEGFDSVASARYTISGTGTAGRFPFTATFNSAPDGGSAVALLGVALAGLEGLRRKLKAA